MDIWTSQDWRQCSWQKLKARDGRDYLECASRVAIVDAPTIALCWLPYASQHLSNT